MSHNFLHRPIFKLSFIACLALVASHNLYGDSLLVTGDAHVNSAFPSVNFGSAPYLEVGGTTRAYIQFNLSSLPTGLTPADVGQVNLILWVNRIGTAGSIQVSEVSGAWTESGITWNNQPGTGSVVGTVPASAANAFLYIDVTSSVKKWLTTPSSNNGFVLDGIPQSAVIYLDSKESVTTSHPATLDVEWGVARRSGSRRAYWRDWPRRTDGSYRPARDTPVSSGRRALPGRVSHGEVRILRRRLTP